MAKWLACEADRSLPSCAKLENEWGYTVLPHMPLCCVLGQLCTLYLPVTDTVLQNGDWDVDACFAFYACIGAYVTVSILNF